MRLDPERTYERYVGEQSTDEFLDGRTPAVAVDEYLAEEPARSWFIESGDSEASMIDELNGDSKAAVRAALIAYVSTERS